MSLLARERRYQDPQTQADTQSVRETFRRATSKVESSIRQIPNSFWLQKNLWTLERIAVVIRKKFRVCCSISHMRCQQLLLRSFLEKTKLKYRIRSIFSYTTRSMTQEEFIRSKMLKIII